MAFRNVTGSKPPRSYTTEELDGLISRYGPEGTNYQDAIAPGTLVWDSTEKVLKVFNGEEFVAV